LCAIAGTAAAESQWTSAETQVAGVPSWMWHQFNACKKKPHYRAMACADDRSQGAYRISGYAFPTAEYAVERVIERCRAAVRQSAILAPCKFRFTGDIDVYGPEGQMLEVAVRVYQQNPNATKKDLKKPATPVPPTS
jgi:hypothetical protein